MNYCAVSSSDFMELAEQNCIENYYFGLMPNEPKFHCYYVYILLCNDKTYYTGVTNNISRRMIEHETGENPASYTFFRRPLKLVFYTEFSNVEFAIEKEKQIKKWSKKKKRALINGEYETLPNLSKKNFH